MARFPKREAEIAEMAGEMVNGLTANADDFPAPPMTPEELGAALDSYRAAHDAAVTAHSAAVEAVDAKNEALESLTDDMRLILHYAEHAVKHDPAKLQALGWGPRKTPAAPQAPGPARALQVIREGPGWVYLDWKRPSEGGAVAGYHVQVADSEGGEWTNVTMCFDTMAVLTDQERGKELIYRVITFNRAGEGLASNTVTALL